MSEKRITKVKLSTGDWNMFSVTTSNYNKNAIGMFKTCIGHVYDPTKKCWLFPNRCYKFLTDLINTSDEFEIESMIPESELNKIQIVIYKEDQSDFFVQTPFNENLVDIFNQLNGFFVPETKLWSFQTSGRAEFDAKMEAEGFDIKFEKDKPKSKINILKIKIDSTNFHLSCL